jgi:23S rRNA (cytosine1962-C5)-methyltransferase
MTATVSPPRVDAQLPLRKDLARHLRAGHPWVFRKAVEKAPGRLPAGAIVDVTEDGRFVARGYYDPLSAISVRILTRDSAEPIDATFWRRRVARAVALRRELVHGTSGYRLVHGEGDGLPGVVVDRYDRFAVLKLYSAGLTPHRDEIVAAVRAEAEGLAGVFGRDEVPRDDDDSESGAGAGRVLWGAEPPERIAVDEHGMVLHVDVRRGQKTGHFLDQRENRRMVRALARGRPEALNLFSYTGGFSVAAALGGARHVVSVDVDRDAIALARENFKANGLDPADHAFAEKDCFDLLAAYRKEGRRFDLVVCDPPAFAKSQKAVEGALAGYASLNRAALAVVAPGGLLVTASCSARVSAEQFSDAVKEAAFKARVELALVGETRQPPDHPVTLQFREGRYLKCMVLRRVG